MIQGNKRRGIKKEVKQKENGTRRRRGNLAPVNEGVNQGKARRRTGNGNTKRKDVKGKENGKTQRGRMWATVEEENGEEEKEEEGEW